MDANEVDMDICKSGLHDKDVVGLYTGGRCRACRNASNNTWRSKNRQYLREYTQRWVNDNPDKVTVNRELRKYKRTHLIALMGGECACCKTANNLEIDHRTSPEERENADTIVGRLLDNETARAEFQLLCQQCNGWKCNGPFCPCPSWDRHAPGWRERHH